MNNSFSRTLLSSRSVRKALIGIVSLLVIATTIAPGPMTSEAGAAAPRALRNFALGAETRQSSTAEPGKTESRVVVDGVSNTLSETERQINPWWEVDLGSSEYLTELKISSRSEDMTEYWVFLSPQPFTSDNPRVVAADPNVTAMRLTEAPVPMLSIPVQSLARYVRVQGKGTLSLAEVEALGPAGLDNFAALGTATQSSTEYNGPPERAIDGSAVGNFRSGSVTSTGAQKNAWWQVDLGVSRRVSEIRVWNRTDCCADRLGDFYVFTSDQPFRSSNPARLARDANVTTKRITSQPDPMTSIRINRTARYVRVQLAGSDVLSLAEVEVVGPKPRNYAPAGTATQSSTSFGGIPEYAQDNNHSGDFHGRTVSHTGRQNQPWWEVDLKEKPVLNEIRVWNRTDCCADRLSDFYVFVSDRAFTSDDPAVLARDANVKTTHVTSQPDPVVSIPVDGRARFVRVQLAGTGILSLGEVEVLGPNVLRLPNSRAWIDQHNFGMFIHYGLSTAADAQWASPNTPPSKFDPGRKVDPSIWVRAAKSAGMEYAVLTAKHHEGFALWPTKYSDYSIASSPYEGGNGDIVRDYVDAARAGGLKPGLYFSIWDRHNTASPELIKNQLREILTNYGEIDYLWFDGLGRQVKETTVPWNDLRDFIQQVSPNTIVGNNDHRFDPTSSDILLDEFVSPLWRPRKTDLPLEVAQPIDVATWFYTTKSEASEPLSADILKQNLETMEPLNVTYLLNVGPRLDGTIDQRYLDVLREVGAR